MNIGIVSPSGLPVPAVYGGAIETLIDNLINENEKQSDHKMFVFSEYEPKSKTAAKSIKNTTFVWYTERLSFRVLNFFFRAFKKIKFIKIPFRVFVVSQYIKIFKIDLLLVEGNPIYVEFIKKIFGNTCKVIFHIHAMLSEDDIHLIPALKKSDKILVVSEFIKSYIVRKFDILPDKIQVVYNCAKDIFFNKPKINNEEFRRTLGITEDDFVIIFTGRLVPEKGLLELVKACNRIDGHIKIKILLVGSFGSSFGKPDEKKDPFENLISEEIKGHEKNYIFCKYISNDNIIDYYNIADLSVIPSLCNDAAPLVTIEAMAASLPIIYSNKGGIKEYIGEECGIMTDMDSENCVETIINSIIKIHDDKELKKGMSLASGIRAKKFTQKNYYKNIIASFD